MVVYGKSAPMFEPFFSHSTKDKNATQLDSNKNIKVQPAVYAVHAILRSAYPPQLWQPVILQMDLIFDTQSQLHF